jgi:hypothetical protein
MGRRNFGTWFLGASSAGAPSGPQAINQTQGKPWAKLSWPFGPSSRPHALTPSRPHALTPSRRPGINCA